MKHCEYCGHDNPDNVTVCEGCGTDDFDKPAAKSDSPDVTTLELHFEPLSPDEMDNDWVTLVKCGNLMEADVLVSHLEVAEIPAFVPDEYAAQAAPFNITAVNGIRVQVAPQDYESARELLESLNEDSDSGPA